MENHNPLVSARASCVRLLLFPAVLLPFVLGALPQPAAARTLPVPFEGEYQIDAWNPDEGFPQNSCFGIGPAPDGSLWFATLRGLVRFNGREFHHWAPAEVPRLARGGIIGLHRDRAGRTWFNTMEGPALHDLSGWRDFRDAPNWGNPRNYIRSYAEHPQGGITFGRFDGDATHFDGARFHPLPTLPGTGTAFCAYDDAGTLYGLRRGFVGHFVDGAWRELAEVSSLAPVALGLGQDPAGLAILVCQREILRLRSGRIVSRMPLSQPVRHFWHLAIDSTGTIWLPAVAVGVYRVSPDGTVRHLTAADGLPQPGSIRVAFPAAHGAIWLGGGIGAIARLRPVRFRHFGPPALNDRATVSVAPLSDGSLLLAPNGAVPHLFDGATQLRPAIDNAQPVLARALLVASDGTRWCGAQSGGLMRWEGDTLVRVENPVFPHTVSINALFEDSQRRLWIGSDRHVAVRTGERFEQVPVPDAPGSTIFAERRDGSVLIARLNAIHAWADGRLQPEPLVRLPDDVRIGTMLDDGHGRLWIGTFAHGLFVLAAGRLHGIPPTRPIPGFGVHALIQDLDGFIWFGTDRRIVRASPDRLWQFVQNPDVPVGLQLFDTEDGLRNLEFPFATQPSVARDARGRLWFGLTRGLTVIDPATLALNKDPPPVIFESLSYVPRNSLEPVRHAFFGAPDGRVTLPPGSRLIRIDYAGLDLAAPTKQRFRIRVDDASEWQDMQHETTVSFLELPPGAHSLQLQAIGGDGAWNRQGATLAFSIAPFYWQTTWFRLATGTGFIAVVAGGAWLASQRRVRRVRDQLAREQRLAAAQARLALVVENTTDFVQFCDPAGNLLFVNRSGRTLAGLGPDAEIAGLPAEKLFAESAREAFVSRALPAAKQDGTWSGELALRRADGREIPVSTVLVAHRALGGALDFVAIIARDISAARRHAAVQEALHGLAAALTASLDPHALGQAIAKACRQLFQHDSFLLYLTDRSGEVAFNAYMEDTPPGGSMPEALPPTPHTPGPAMRPLLEGGSLLVNRDPSASPDDDPQLAPFGYVQRRSESLLFVPILRDGRTVGIVSVQSYTPRRYDASDLQQLKIVADHCAAAVARLHAEMQLRENEERLRLAMQTARLGSWEIDLATRSLLVSPEAEALYGHPLDRTPEALANGISASHADAFRQLLADLLDGRISDLSQIHPLASAAGRERWLEVKAHRRKDPDTGRTRIIGITADITTRQHAELERARLEEQLRQSSKLEAMGTLAGGIAHDFNNILTAILGNVELARIEATPLNPTREFLDRIRESALRARDLVRRLLAFSRPHPAHRRVTPLQPVVQEVINLLRATIPATTELRVALAADAPAVEVDPTEVHQVLLNLGTNAWHALGNGSGFVAFTLDACAFAPDEPRPHPDLRPGRYARVRVQDNGQGIAPESLPRIFDPFFTTKGPGEGTGLGLSVAHGIMRASGGAIAVRSTPGVGTTFDLYFPASSSAAASSEAAPRVARESRAAPYSGRVLFVDDEQPVLQVARLALTRAGYTVTACSRAAEALARFRDDPHAFDIVLSDLAMPEMSGLQLAEQLLALRPDLPVLIASGHIRPDFAAEARRIGVRAVIEKLDAFEALPALLARHLSAPPRA